MPAIRRNPGLFALLRSFTLNLLRFNGHQYQPGLYDNALNFDSPSAGILGQLSVIRLPLLYPYILWLPREIS